MLHTLSTIWGFKVYFRKFSFVTNPAWKKSAKLSLSQYFSNLFDHGPFFLLIVLTVGELLQ